MKTAVKKLTSAIIAVILAMAALGTTTFAWITLTNTVTIAPFSAEVTTGDGIEISVDGGLTFFSDVPQTEINKALLKAGYYRELDGSNQVLDYGDFRFDLLTSVDGKVLKGFDGEIANNGFIELDFVFRARNTVSIYLAEGTKLSSVGIDWRADATFTSGKGTPLQPGDIINFKAAHGARISVSSNIATVVFEMPESANSLDGSKMVSGNTVLGTEVISLGAVEYYNVKHSNAPLNPAGVLVVASLTDLSLASSAIALLELNSQDMLEDRFIYGTVTARIWIEGWDADSFNAILSDNLAAQFVFSTIKPGE